MTINGYDLNSLKSFEAIKLIAGAEGLSKYISKPYVCTTVNIKPWVTGDELLFIPTYLLTIDDNAISNIVMDSIKEGTYGVVIIENMNDISKFSKKIPRYIIDLCDKHKLPFYIMPYELKLAGVVDEIYRLITSNYKNSDEKELMLKNLLFYPDKKFDYNDMNINLNYIKNALNFGYIGIASSNDNSILNNFRKLLKANIDSKIEIIHLNFFNQLIFLALANSIDKLKIFNNKIIEKFELNYNDNKKYKTYFSVGKYVSNIQEIQKSYHSAIEVSNLLNKNIFPTNSLNYNDIGLILNILENSYNNDVLIKTSLEYLAPIINYDFKHNSELLRTMYFYLLNDCNVIKTANSLFIHRNTVSYRKNLIENLLSTSLNNSLSRFKYLLSILICLYNESIDINLVNTNN